MAILSLPIILGDGIEPSRPGLRTDFPIDITLVLRLERLRLCQGVRTEFTIRSDADDLLPQSRIISDHEKISAPNRFLGCFF